MSSRRSKKSASNHYPTKWSEWVLSDQHDCNIRYREKGNNDWEWEYENRPVLAESERILTASTESACLDPSGQQPLRKQKSGGTSQLDYDDDASPPDDIQGRVYDTQDTLQQGEPPENGIADITNGLSQTTLSSDHDQYPHDNYSQNQYLKGYSPYPPSHSQPVYAQQPYEPSQERKMKTVRARDNHNMHKVLDSRYKVYQASEFQIGRVFELPWYETNRNSAPNGSMLESDSEITESEIWSKSGSRKVRKFLVVDPGNDRGHSICLPIKTYGYQGVTKRGLHPKDHAVIYSSKQLGPLYLPAEEDQGLMTLEPIRVEISQNHSELHALSRLNYANPHKVECNVKVRFIGRVAKPYERRLRKDFARINAHDESNSTNTRDMNQSIHATSEFYSNQGGDGPSERYRPKNGASYAQVTAEGGLVFRDYGGQYEDEYGDDGARYESSRD